MPISGLCAAARLALRLGLLLVPAAAAAQQVQVVVAPVPASALAWDPGTKRIYACVGSGGGGAMANTITTINPANGAVERSVFIGSEPSHLVVSAGGRYLYTAVSDGRSVRRYDIAAHTAGPQFAVGEGLTVTALAPMPGLPEAVVVMRHRPGVSPNDEGVAVYIDGVPRPRTVNAGHSLAVGIAPSRLFGYENQISTYGLTGLTVTPDGVVGAGTSGDLIYGNDAIVGANGLLYTCTGRIVDPEARQIVGKLPGLGWGSVVLPDADTGRAYHLSGERATFQLGVYDTRTYTLLGTTPITGTGGSGGPGSPILWGDDGLAFTAGDRVVLVTGARGPKLPKADLSVKRSAIPAAVPANGRLSYVLTVANAGPGGCSGACVSDALPAEAEVLEVKASQGNGSAASHIVRADLGELKPGTSATVSVTLQFAKAAPLEFTAVARGYEPDPAPGNNLLFTAPSTAAPSSPVAAARPDLTATWARLRQVSQGAGVNLRATIAGSIVVRNQGQAASAPCRVRFYLSDAPAFRPEFGQLLQEVAIPALARGRSVSVSLQAPLGAGDDATGLFVHAVVDAAGEVPDANRDNNTVRMRIP